MKGEKELSRNNWTREETLVAFLLYCKIPFGKINKNNPQIIELAGLLNRTPSAVGMKMFNLAHKDPSQMKRGIQGLKNGSKVEHLIWSEYEEKGIELIYEAEQLRAKLENKVGEAIYQDYTMDLAINGENMNEPLQLTEFKIGTDRHATVKRRVGQQFFRASVLSSYDNKCCVTGISIPSLLIASHIKPWKDSDDITEKTNPKNGLCLNALHDKAFDNGLITIDKEYKIVVSSKLMGTKIDDITKLWISSANGKQITLPTRFIPDKRFIEYHNDIIFQR